MLCVSLMRLSNGYTYGFQFIVAARRPYHHIIPARLHTHASRLLVPCLKQFVRQWNAYRALLAGRECHTLITAQSLVGALLVPPATKIQLHDFCTGHFAGITYLHSHDAVGIAGLAILICSIAQSVAERKQRRLAQIAVCASLHTVLVEGVATGRRRSRMSPAVCRTD